MTIRSICFLFVLFLLSGCLPTGQSSGPSNGGVFRSADGGISFEARNVISEESSLARSNITSLTISASNSNEIYAGTQNDGIYVSRNAGENWEKLNFPPSQVDAFALDPQDSNVLYVAATWEGVGRVYRSENGGESWDQIYLEPVTGTRVSTIVLKPGVPGTIFIGTTLNSSRNSAIVVSRDSGKTWKNVRTNSSSIIEIIFDPVDPDQIYVHTSKNDIYRSSDSGNTWTSIKNYKRDKSQGEKSFDGTLYSFFVHEKNPGELYAGTNKSLYRSVDYGDTWEEVDIIGTAKGVPIRAISVSPFDRDRLTFASAKAIYVQVGEGRYTVTDTQSSQVVSVIDYDPVDPAVVYIGFYNVKK